MDSQWCIPANWHWKAPATGQNHLVQTMVTTPAHQHPSYHQRATLQIYSSGITMLQCRKQRLHTRWRRMQVFVNNCIFGILNVKRKEMHDNQRISRQKWTCGAKQAFHQWQWKLAPGSSAGLDMWHGYPALDWKNNLYGYGSTPAMWPRPSLTSTRHFRHQPGLVGTTSTLPQNFKIWRGRMGLSVDPPGNRWPRTTMAQRCISLAKSQGSQRKWGPLAEQTRTRRQSRTTSSSKSSQAETANYQRNPDGSILCPHCNEPFAPNRVWQHARSCAVSTRETHPSQSRTGAHAGATGAISRTVATGAATTHRTAATATRRSCACARGVSSTTPPCTRQTATGQYTSATSSRTTASSRSTSYATSITQSSS